MEKKRKNEITAPGLAIERLEEEILPRLNAEHHSRRVKRVGEVVSLLGGLREGVSTREKISLLSGLRTHLSAYRWVSSIALGPDGFFVLNNVEYKGQDKEELWEHEAVRNLLLAFPLLNIGKRPLIRRCEAESCKRWFLARRVDKRMCSSACRQWVYDSSPEIRERKARTMRNNRKTEKEREAREALAAVREGFTSQKRRVVSKKSR